MLLLAVTLVVGRMIADQSEPHEPSPQGSLHTGAPRVGGSLTTADERLRAEVTVRGLSFADAANEAVASGFLHFFDGDYQTAMQRFNEAWVLDPDNGDLYHGFALLIFERGDTTGAERMFRAAIARQRVSASAYANYGRFLIAAERYGEAAGVLEDALAREPGFAPAEARLAIAHFGAGEVDAACRRARAVIDRAPDAEASVLEDILDHDACG